MACEIELPDWGLNPGQLHWERGTLGTGPPGKSWRVVLTSRGERDG